LRRRERTVIAPGSSGASVQTTVRMGNRMKASPGQPTRTLVPVLLGVIALLLCVLLAMMATAGYLLWIRPTQQVQAPRAERTSPETAARLINEFDGSPLATCSLNGAILADPAIVRQAALSSLEAPEMRVRFAAVYALSLTADPSNREPLSAVMEREEDMGLRILAARALIALGQKESIPVLVAALPSDEPLPFWNPPEPRWVLAYADLNQYTGEDFGFLAAVESGDAAARAAAIEAWQDWWTEVGADLEWDPSGERYIP